MTTIGPNDPPLSNPAGRLWHLVRDGKGARSQYLPQAIAQIFKIAPDDPVQVMRGIANFLNLIAEVDRWMRLVPDINAERHLAWVDKTRHPFKNIGLGSYTQMAHLVDPFDESAMSLIFICSDHLERYFSEPVANDSGVRSLLDQALALMKRISRSSIDPPIREYMLRHLQIVVDALFDFRTHGFESLWNGLTASRGHYDAGKFRRGVTTEKVHACPDWVKVTAIVTGLAALVDSAQRIEYVLEKGSGALQWFLPVPVTEGDQGSAGESASKPHP